jgi:hypothetical protein
VPLYSAPHQSNFLTIMQSAVNEPPLGLGREDRNPLPDEDGTIELPADHGGDPREVARGDRPLHMGLKGRCIRVGLMEIEVSGIFFILNGLEPEVPTSSRRLSRAWSH